MSGGILGLPGSIHNEECADVGIAQGAQRLWRKGCVPWMANAVLVIKVS